MKLYGIPTCDSVRKARRILDQRGAHYQYIDLRQNPPDDALLRDWFARFGSALVNKRSTTYREHKAAVLAAEAAGDDALIALLRQYRTLIKRPVISRGDDVWLGLNVPPHRALFYRVNALKPPLHRPPAACPHRCFAAPAPSNKSPAAHLSP